MSKIIRNTLTIPWRGKSREQVEVLIKRYLQEDENAINEIVDDVEELVGAVTTLENALEDLSDTVESLIANGPWNSGAVWNDSRVWAA